MKYNTKSDKMRILISNLKGKALLNIAMKNGVDKLVSVYSTYNETSLLDQYITKENIKLETTNAIEACQRRRIHRINFEFCSKQGRCKQHILLFQQSNHPYAQTQLEHVQDQAQDIGNIARRRPDSNPYWKTCFHIQIHGLQTHQQPYGRRSGCSEKTIREILPHRRRKNAYNLIF